MTTKRSGHTAILLPNKQVLVTGGGYVKDDGTMQYLASTETYDPIHGVWNQSGSLSTECSDHAAALLQNGKVLVMGGYNGNYLANSWLYNYETRQWTSTSGLATSRQYHTATVLNSGKVLVVGGYHGYQHDNVWQVLPNELYDPVLGRWADTGAMVYARKQHTATLLSNGKVLVTGGHDGSNALTNSMLYDPTNGQWNQTGELITGRFNHTATLLFNGKVLVVGGQGKKAPDAYLTYLNNAELYDPITGQWSQIGTLDIGRALHTATLLPNRNVLIAGGYNDAYLDSVELYNIATGLWILPTANLETARGGHTATLLSDGRVLIAGGRGIVSEIEDELNSAEIYAPDLITTTATLTSSLNPSNINQSITFTAKIASTPIMPLPIGTVKFKVDDTIKAISSLNNGQVTYITNSLATGNRTIKAEYTGNFVWNPSNAQLNQIVNPGGVDLVITSIKLNPVVPLPNQAFVVRVVVKNQGTRPSANSNLSLWLNKSSEEMCKATSDKKQAVGTLAAGASKVLYFSGLTTTVGDKTLLAFVDSDCIVGEVGENNNQFTTEYTVGMPDLTVTSITLLPVNPSSNTAFQANVIIKNQGTAISSPSFLDLWLNQAANQSCGAAGDQWIQVESLAVGVSKTIPFTGLKVATAGAKTMRAYIDSWCESTDINRNNNQFTKAYTVISKPDFVINSVTLIPASPPANSTFKVVTVITNKGTIAGNAGNLKVWSNQTTNPTCSIAGDKFLSVGTLAVGVTASFTINGLSAGNVGTKTLWAFIDGNCLTAESNELNNQYSQTYTVR